jgi:hypothetical protein
MYKASNPWQVRPETIVRYWPFFGTTSPEPELRAGDNMTLTGGPELADEPPNFTFTTPALWLPTLAGAAPTTPEGSGLASLTLDAVGIGQSVRNGSGTAALTLDAIGVGQSLRSGSALAPLTLDATATGKSTRNGSALADLVLDCIGVGESEALQNQLVLTATQVGSSVFLEWEFAT